MTTKRTLDALASPRWSRRIEGLKALASESGFEELLRFALQEPEPGVISVACDLLFPEPTELLVHLLSLQKGPDAPLEFRYRIPAGNYLYAEPALYQLFRPRFARLSLDYIEGFGLGYLRSLGEALQRYVRPHFRTYAAAVRDGSPEAKPHRWNPASNGSDQWDGASEKSLAAIIALRRLRHPVASTALSALRGAASLVEHKHLSLVASAIVEWAEFDIGTSTDPAQLENSIMRGAFELVPDYGTTLLRRGDDAELINRLTIIWTASPGWCILGSCTRTTRDDLITRH